MESCRQKKYSDADFDWEKPIEKSPVTNGFDYYFGDGTINFPPYAWIENNKFVEAPSTVLNLEGQNTAEGNWECRGGPAANNWDIPGVPVKLTKKAVSWINDQKEKTPFFLYFALPSPHAPIIPAKQFQGKSEAGGYGDYMMQTDWMVGQVMETLKANDMDKNTIVIFTSDNGPELYAYDRIKNHEHYSMGDLRGLKRDLWEGGHRVPFIVKYPGVVSQNSVSNNLICQTDIMKTIADLVNIEVPENAGEDSRSFSRMLKNTETGTPTRHSVVHHTINGKFAIRQGNWTLIENTTGRVTKQPEWVEKQYSDMAEETPMVLYNVAEDPGERRNLYKRHPKIVEELMQILRNTRGY